MVFIKMNGGGVLRTQYLFFVLLFIAGVHCCLGQESIIPRPNNIALQEGSFAITPKTVIVTGRKTAHTAAFLNDYLKTRYGFALKTVSKTIGSNAVFLTAADQKGRAKEGYRLRVGRNGIYIEGNDEAGCFYGMQSLIQLLPTDKQAALKVPYIKVTDAPRFSYRGAMLDAARHFFSVAYTKRFIDYLALHKINTFHWHLTDDQGWRIEIKQYPRLTAIGSQRSGSMVGHLNTKHPEENRYNTVPYGGYYTQDEVKDIVQYAAARYITVIPEIEMPGHSQAALAAYPYLGCTGGPYQVSKTWGVHTEVYCAGNDTTFTFLQKVLDEVLELFPSQYIHIGGDECPKIRWKSCSRCQQRMRVLGLNDEHRLQVYFMNRIGQYLKNRGRKIIAWDDILEGNDHTGRRTTTVMSWRGDKGGIEGARLKYPVIMTPDDKCYLDYSQTKQEDSLVIGGYLPLDMVYRYEPLPQVLTPEEGRFILGSQANVWTEYISNPAKLEYMVFPRLSALSEVLWSAKKDRDFGDFKKRLADQLQRYRLWGINYFNQ